MTVTTSVALLLVSATPSSAGRSSQDEPPRLGRSLDGQLLELGQLAVPADVTGISLTHTGPAWRRAGWGSTRGADGGAHVAAGPHRGRDGLAAGLAGALERQVDQPGDELVVGADGRHAHHPQPDPLGGLRGLGVEVEPTSMWSETNPIGATTTSVTPSAASSSSRSLTSGSSHGWDGGPEREQ